MPATSSAAPWSRPRCCASRGSSPPGSRISAPRDRKSTRLNSSHANISYAVFCLKNIDDDHLQDSVARTFDHSGENEGHSFHSYAHSQSIDPKHIYHNHMSI